MKAAKTQRVLTPHGYLIRATVVSALDHEERRESLPMKMPHLPATVGGAFFMPSFQLSA